MSDSKLVLVMGATGAQGGSVSRALFARGHRVRGLTRNSESPAALELRRLGAEIAVGDFADADSLAAAVAGVDSVYAMGTPFESGVEGEAAQGKAIVDAARAAGVEHFVYGSVASADRETGIPHFDSKHKVEKHLQASGLNYTIVAPVYFMDNLVQPWNLPALQQGRLALPMPSTRALQQIAVSDIGSFAAAVIDRSAQVFGKRYDIAGDEISGEQAAAMLSSATGRPIGYEEVPLEAMRAQSEDMALMFEWFETTGYMADVDELRGGFPEVEWTDYESWLAQQNWSKLAE